MSAGAGVGGLDYLGFIERDSALLAAAVATAGLDAAVPSCPAWKVQDLLEHITGVHHWVKTTVRTRPEGWIDRSTLAPFPPFSEGAAELVEVLRSTAPDEKVWNWSLQPHVAAFWPRRMAHETAVHRWDAEAAVSGSVGGPIDAALAVDGIDEYLDTFAPVGASFRPERALDGTLHLHCTDVEGEWLVSVGDGKVDVAKSHGKGDAAVRGTASDVLLFVWGRLAPGSDSGSLSGSLESFGDPAVLERWRALTAG